MTDRDIIQLFEQHRPSTVQEIEALGINIEHLADGASRAGYKIGRGLVMKIPFAVEGRAGWCIRQSINEIEFLEDFESTGNILSEIKQQLTPHLPPLFYGDKENGIIVSRFYPRGGNPNDLSLEQERLKELFWQAGVNDMHYGNYRINESGHLVAIDLGSTF